MDILDLPTPETEMVIHPEDKALLAYLNKLTEARNALERIAEYLENNGEVDPEQVNWGHVGSLNYLTSQLLEIKGRLDGTGEYAETEIMR